MTDDHLEGREDRSALIALLKIFFLVVLSNVLLYLAIVYFAVVLFHRTVPSFLAFIQFLAFILPIALILRLGLREAPAAVPVDNIFLKKMGATPTLVVISSLAAFFATFTPLGAQIFPKPEATPTLVAKVGVACRVDRDNTPSRGAYFLTLIYSDDTDYIRSVRSQLSALKDGNKTSDDKPLLYRVAENLLAQLFGAAGLIDGPKLAAIESSFSQIKFVEKSDQFYWLLTQDPQAAKETLDLKGYLSNDSRWTAFITPVGQPDAYTQVPIYSRSPTRNHTRVFLVTFPADTAPKNISGNPLDAAAAAPPRGSRISKFEIRKISELEILPEPLESGTQKAELNVTVLPIDTCWTKDPADAL